MSRVYFHVEETTIYTELLLLKKLVSEQEIYDNPCPLLLCQLNELEVLLSLLQKRVGILSRLMKIALEQD